MYIILLILNTNCALVEGSLEFHEIRICGALLCCISTALKISSFLSGLDLKVPSNL